MEAVRRRAQRSTFEVTFLRVVTVWSAISHVAVAFATVALFQRLLLPSPVLLGATVGFLLFAPARPLISSILPDHPRSPWRIWGLEIPYLVHWCASQVALLFLIGGALAWVVSALWPGLGDISLPLAALAGYLVGLAVSIWGMLVRPLWVRVRRITVHVPGLNPVFDGYRIAHLSDLHLGSFCSPARGKRWVALANLQSADLAVVTGDFVSSGVAFHDPIARVVGELRAPDGVAVIPGNHDYFGDGYPLFQLLTDRGIRLLRNEWFVVERATQRLVIAGVDDTWTRRANLPRTLQGRPPDIPTVLLAHNPALFDQAARARVELVLSGHTHGGQLALPFLTRWMSLLSLSTPYRFGLYRSGMSTLYVNAGLGTTGPPIRVGAAPEIAIIELRSGS